MRYLPLSDTDRADMLTEIGVSSIDELFIDVPQSARLNGAVEGLPNHQSELMVDRHMRKLAAKNLAAQDTPFFLGAGAYRHHVPATVDHLIQRSEFLTAYTPYQPEISQGTLQTLFEFQTQVARLTGMEIANASMYDGSTAASEAVLMAMRVTRRGKAVLSGALHPHYRAVIETNLRHGTGEALAAPLNINGDETLDVPDDAACVVVQNPDLFGNVRDLGPVAEAAHAKGALLIVVVTEPVSLGAVKSPGAMGADIVVGEGQGIGVGLQFGGPYVGLFATRQKYVRQMPGRIAGETVDANGQRGFVLTLSTREQHIRREKATSNICTNSGLCALAFSIHLSLLGETGLRGLAAVNHARAGRLAAMLGALPGVEVKTSRFFNEFTVDLGRAAAPVVDALAEKGIVAGLPASRLLPGEAAAENLLIVAATETATDEDEAAYLSALQEVLS